ncbi:U32 family peptidase [Phragmitibacter flavus]|uniref:U32 family peptidase n=2 Tax=Phragmitibacter flavus TaxID=2576071 RepID=A0A5R8KEE4_9BACT|nr:U32 family peptidase [Phragmitibacter flavus]
MPKFNARLRADNFSEEDLPELMSALHEHGVKGYCAFNTLIFTKELEAAEEQLRVLEAAGVDAVIVQDLGLARLVKRVTPGLHLHASTQMTITSPEGLKFARRLGLDLAVLSRELSLRDLERFAKEGEEDRLPLEVFVHGALCVAYSGQCLTSESLGRRSANRGECAQACRMPYEMIVDGVKVDLGDKRYLLSPQDLAAVEEIPRLMELGVKSFKIEGRLKSPEYVAAVTQVYRKAIDAAMAGNGSEVKLRGPDKYALEMTFSRGLYPGWMHGVNHQELVGARFGKKRGAFLGVVSAVDLGAVELDGFAVPLKAGDGVVFENPADTNKEKGGYVFGVKNRWMEFGHGKIDFEGIKVGTRVFKTSDPALDRQLRASFAGDLRVRKQGVLNLRVSGREGELLEVMGNGKVVKSQMPLQAAMKRPLSVEVIGQQFGKLGGTPFELGEVVMALEGDLILPMSEMNRMRRELVDLLLAEPPVKTWVVPPVFEMPVRESEVVKEPKLLVTCRTIEQVEVAMRSGVMRIYADFEDIRRYADVVKRVREGGDGVEIFLATPRIQKSGEEGFFKLIERAEPDGVLVRNLGALEYFAATGMRMTGDFSLNVANPLTAEFLVGSGLERVTVSYDLNAQQVLDLIEGGTPSWFELTLHQHMPMFHMEHCVFAAFLSEGKSFLDCGRPCEKHVVKLRDRVGMEHPLKADVGCRNTLFNAVPQTGAKFFGELMAAGLRFYRVELLEESAEETIRVLEMYRGLLSGERDGTTLWRELKAQSQLGVVTSGTLESVS